MEVDSNDAEFDLINKLNTMGTRDREDLLAQFQSIVGVQMSPACCSFYLEMGNWNLQAALCAYYDVMSSPESIPLMELVDETVHVNENSVKPNVGFTKTWRLRNIGSEKWPYNLKLKFIRGYNFGHGEVLTLPPLDPSETTDVSVIMTSPAEDGLYQSQWRAVTITGKYCSCTLTVAVNVDSSNVASLADSFSLLGHANNTTHCETSQPISTPLRPPVAATPYCSPTGYGIFGGAPVWYYETTGKGCYLKTVTSKFRKRLLSKDVDVKIQPPSGMNGQLPTINEAQRREVQEQQQTALNTTDFLKSLERSEHIEFDDKNR